jgi:hypothetical protein
MTENIDLKKEEKKSIVQLSLCVWISSLILLDQINFHDEDLSKCRILTEIFCERNEIIREKSEKIRAKSEMIRENMSSKRKFESWKNLLFFWKKNILNFRNKIMFEKTIWILLRKNEIVFRKTSSWFKRIRDEIITRAKRFIESHI